jgi:glucosamine--fructose-6-phosphate aminotransferase (isomerizing)
MCGIIGYVGQRKDAIDIALRGLEQLEYRGYDSAGLAAFCYDPDLRGGGYEARVCKSVGEVKNLVQKIGPKPHNSSCAIAHTRWATHGVPSVKNAHPHHDCKKDIFLVHNGIIENYEFLKDVLEREGHRFFSDTDTEVLAHLIERHKEKYTSLEEAVINALGYVKGTFALAVISRKEPHKIVAARRSSPLIVGLLSKQENGYLLASDASAITKYTKKVIYLDDDEIAVLMPDSLQFLDFKKKNRQKDIDNIEWGIEEARKGGFPHFMLKEIHQQPDSVRDSLRGRLMKKEGCAKLGGLEFGRH